MVGKLLYPLTCITSLSTNSSPTYHQSKDQYDSESQNNKKLVPWPSWLRHRANNAGISGSIPLGTILFWFFLLLLVLRYFPLVDNALVQSSIINISVQITWLYCQLTGDIMLLLRIFSCICSICEPHTLEANISNLKNA